MRRWPGWRRARNETRAHTSHRVDEHLRRATGQRDLADGIIRPQSQSLCRRDRVAGRPGAVGQDPRPCGLAQVHLDTPLVIRSGRPVGGCRQNPVFHGCPAGLPAGLWRPSAAAPKARCPSEQRPPGVSLRAGRSGWSLGLQRRDHDGAKNLEDGGGEEFAEAEKSEIQAEGEDGQDTKGRTQPSGEDIEDRVRRLFATRNLPGPNVNLVWSRWVHACRGGTHTFTIERVFDLMVGWVSVP